MVVTTLHRAWDRMVNGIDTTIAMSAERLVLINLLLTYFFIEEGINLLLTHKKLFLNLLKIRIKF